MILYLTEILRQLHDFFDVLRYITVRSIGSTLTALFITLFGGPFIIRLLRLKQVHQVIRAEGPQSHHVKKGTPTMGGVLIAGATLISSLLWADISILSVRLLILTVFLFSIIGMVDDYRKIKGGNAKGMAAREKFFWQSLAAFILVIILYYGAEFAAQTQLIIPIFKEAVYDLGPGFIVLGYLVIVSSVNSVNMTDGLDGLVLIPTILIMSALMVFGYVAGNYVMADYLQLPYIPNVGEVTVFGGALVGACLGFLWYNTYPAQIFMGDTGSMLLGGCLGLVAILVRQEIIYFIMSGIFVAETLSVIIQVGCYKTMGRRPFRMAPLHHHFELMGIPEPKVIVRFWIVTMVLVTLGLATLKIR